MPGFVGNILADAEPTRPLITWYDDQSGDRAELSGATLANWVAKTANLLVDGGGLGPGDRAAVLLPPHWQTAAVLLGAWSANVSVSFRLAATAALAPTGYRDLITALEPYHGTLPGYTTLRATDAASVDGDRVLVDAAEHEHAVHWLLAPFAAGATVALCANLDRSR